MNVEALEALIASPGWQLYVQHIGDEWGPKAYAQKIKDAVRHARSVGKDAGFAIDAVDAANDAIAEAMRWPREELARQKRQEQKPEMSMSRRGTL